MIQVGNATLHPVIEQADLAFPIALMQPDADVPALLPHLDWLAPDHWNPLTSEIHISHHAWVAITPAGIVVVDPCVGNGRHRPLTPFYNNLDTPFLQNLEKTGIRREDVNFVVCTHLHLDHVGWNTMLQDGNWVPTFPNARYVFSRREHDFWAQDLTGNLPPGSQINEGVYVDSIKPVVDAGLALLIDEEAGFDFANGVFSVIATPGHSVGSMSIIMDGGSDGALFCGDALHWPAQIVFPDWGGVSNHNDVQAIASRRKVLNLCADRNLLLATQHFCGDHACRIERVGNGFRPRWVR